MIEIHTIIRNLLGIDLPEFKIFEQSGDWIYPLVYYIIGSNIIILTVFNTTPWVPTSQLFFLELIETTVQSGDSHQLVLAQMGIGLDPLVLRFYLENSKPMRTHELLSQIVGKAHWAQLNVMPHWLSSAN